MTPEEQLLLQQQQKLEGIEQQQRYNLFRSPGQVQGETPQQFAAGKQAANSQAQGYGANPAPVSQPPVQSVAQPVVQQTPARKTQGTVQNKPAITNMDELAAAMGYTSPEQEEKLRKASVANQRILALGDALRHIGNIATTINYAPSQQFNNPVQEEYARYERGKALRDKANQTYLTYQQAKAAQDAKQRQWEMQFRYNAAKDAANLKAQQDYHNATIAERARQADQNYKLNVRKADDAKAKAEADRKLRDTISRRSNSLGWANHNLAKEKFNYQKTKGGGSGNKTTNLRGKNGWYSKNMNSEEAQAFYNQTYDEMKRRGFINEDSVLKGLPADIFGQKSVSLAAKKAAVDDALMQHPEVGDWLADEFEFEFDPRYSESGTPLAPTNEPPFQAPWSSGYGQVTAKPQKKQLPGQSSEKGSSGRKRLPGM